MIIMQWVQIIDNLRCSLGLQKFIYGFKSFHLALRKRFNITISCFGFFIIFETFKECFSLFWLAYLESTKSKFPLYFFNILEYVFNFLFFIETVEKKARIPQTSLVYSIFFRYVSLSFYANSFTGVSKVLKAYAIRFRVNVFSTVVEEKTVDKKLSTKVCHISR